MKYKPPHLATIFYDFLQHRRCWHDLIRSTTGKAFVRGMASICSSGFRGGAMGAMPPPCLVKLGQKKMAAECGGLYFMFLGPPSPKSLDLLLIWGVSQCCNKLNIVPTITAVLRDLLLGFREELQLSVNTVTCVTNIMFLV